jgi:hypothetical protein
LQALETYGLLIRPAKTSYTAGTLYAIFSEQFGMNGSGGIRAAAKQRFGDGYD